MDIRKLKNKDQVASQKTASRNQNKKRQLGNLESKTKQLSPFKRSDNPIIAGVTDKINLSRLSKKKDAIRREDKLEKFKAKVLAEKAGEKKKSSIKRPGFNLTTTKARLKQILRTGAFDFSNREKNLLGKILNHKKR